MKILNKIFLFLSILWAVVIFMFSNQNGTESSELSGQITVFIANIFLKGCDALSIRGMYGILSIIEFFIRKLAHFTEYAIFAGLIYTTVITGVLWRGNRKITDIWQEWKIKAGTIAEASVIVYALTDELHQGIVSGRNPSLWDVLIDSAGGFAAVLFATAFLTNAVRNRHRKP